MSSSRAAAAPFDAARFALPLPEGNGLLWEDPREIHRVVVHFKGSAPAPNTVRVEYWGSWWPERHLPKDREPGGGDMGWMELGNWWKYGWRQADTEVRVDANALTFTFRPVNAKEVPKAGGYAATFRYTLKVRIVSEIQPLEIDRIEAFTDSKFEERAFRLAWDKGPQPGIVDVFNGRLIRAESVKASGGRFVIDAVTNSDPNTFDRTLITVQRGEKRFTFKFDDLVNGALFVPHAGVAVLTDSDSRSYAAVASEQKSRSAQTLYDRVAEMPEQSWRAAWDGMPPKKSHIYFPLGLDGGRQRFRLHANGSFDFRHNEHYLTRLPGRETPRFKLEKPTVSVSFGLPDKPKFRELEEKALPVVQTIWEADGLRTEQSAFVTALDGTDASGPAPSADTFTVLVSRFSLVNETDAAKVATLPITIKSGGQALSLRIDDAGLIWSGDNVRGQLIVDGSGTPSGIGKSTATQTNIVCSVTLGPKQSHSFVLKIPYVVLTEAGEREALTNLDFNRERSAVASYWRRRLDASAKLITPEPMLNEFYRSHAMHLLVNCEREPGSDRRFARVGSFSYGAYGNESCMMVVDLERRGYHKEAQDCLDAWLKYQGTVSLPGSFEGKDGVLYGAAGYEAGGYNQHHGWILWMLGEHFRYTRDEPWLRGAAPGIVKGADWIIRETARTKDRHELERGLLPSGSLEDIGDWWTWLSTSCYTWRGLDSAAWALEQIRHPDAKRIRKAAGDYHRALITNFTKAMERSPVIRLRDGTAVPKVPSHVHRRGRTFGWICETLEGSLHLLITRAIDPKSQLGTWIVNDYEDNLYLSNQYGYTLDDFDKQWFGRGGMSMQACLLLDVEPYLYRDDVKHALRALFNGQAVSYFPDVRMNTEHALPFLDDWRGDHFKSSDEANCTGWLRHLFVREDSDTTLLIGQAVPREWLQAGKQCGIEKTSTWFGPASVLYTAGEDEITAKLDGPTRNPPKQIRLRFRCQNEKPLASVTVNGKRWKKFKGEWVDLPGNIGNATVVARY